MNADPMVQRRLADREHEVDRLRDYVAYLENRLRDARDALSSHNELEILVESQRAEIRTLREAVDRGKRRVERLRRRVRFASPARWLKRRKKSASS